MKEEMNEVLHENEEQTVDNTDAKNVLYTERMELESMLAGSDYKVSKCAEAMLAGLEMPYDITTLHAQRKQWRDRINAIDIEIESLDGIEPTEEELLVRAKAAKIDEIAEYDASANVNAFTVDGNPMWLNHDLRSRLRASLAVCKDETMTKYFAGVPYTFPVALWQQMLDAVEAYADRCQTVTESHKATVMAMTTLADIKAFDFRADYPSKLAF